MANVKNLCKSKKKLQDLFFELGVKNDGIVAIVFMKAALTKVQEILQVKFLNVNTRIDEIKELQDNLREDLKKLRLTFDKFLLLDVKQEKARNNYIFFEMLLVKWKQLQQEDLNLETLENFIKGLKGNLVLVEEHIAKNSEKLSDESSVEKEVTSLLGTNFLEEKEKRMLLLYYNIIHKSFFKIYAASSNIENFMKNIEIQTKVLIPRLKDKEKLISEEEHKEFLNLFTTFINATQDLEILYKKVLQTIKKINYYYFHSRKNTNASALYENFTKTFYDLKLKYGYYYLNLTMLLNISLFTDEEKKDIAEIRNQMGLALEILEEKLDVVRIHLGLVEESIAKKSEKKLDFKSETLSDKSAENKVEKFFVSSFLKTNEKKKFQLLLTHIYKLYEEFSEYKKSRDDLKKEYDTLSQNLIVSFQKVISLKEKHMEFLNLFTKYRDVLLSVGLSYVEALNNIKEINDYFFYSTQNTKYTTALSSLELNFFKVLAVKLKFWHYIQAFSRLKIFIASLSIAEEKVRNLLNLLNKYNQVT